MNIITSVSQLQDALTFIHNADKLALDSETTGLRVRHDKVIGFGISDGQTGYYFTHLAWDGQQLVEVLPAEACITILKALAPKRLIFYNASFDVRMFLNYFKVNLVDSIYSDGILAFHTIAEDGVPFSHTGFSLKTVGPYYFGEEVVAEQTDLKASIAANGGTRNEFYKADATIMAKYCIRDCELTYKLNEKFYEQMEKEDLVNVYESEVLPLQKYVVIPMENHGIKLDIPAMIKAREEITKTIEQSEAEIHAAIQPHLAEFEEYFMDKDYPAKRTGPFADKVVELFAPDQLPKTPGGSYSFSAKAITAMPEGPIKNWLHGLIKLSKAQIEQVQRAMHGPKPMFNLLSKYHLRRLFINKLGETALNFTETGLPQVDEDFLDSIKHKYEWLPKLLEFNKLVKIRSTYIDRFLDAQDGGRFYPSYKQFGTVSGRLSGDFQQLPRPLAEDGEPSELVRYYSNQIRAFFIADEGHIFIDDDYESAEPRIFAHISNEQGLKDVFAKGEDFYSKICLLVEGLHEFSADKKAPNYLGKLKKEKRQQAKVYALGIPYSMSGFKLQYEINVPLKEAEALVKKYLTTFPNLAAWMQATYRKVATEGKIRIESGRIRHLGRATTLYHQYGDVLFDDLALWKKFNSEPAIYEKAKKARREFKNLIANGSNVQIQGMVASMINKASIAIAKEFKAAGMKSLIVGQLHDELLSQVPFEEKDKAAEIIQRCMENAIKFSVPMVAVPSFGFNFKEAKG